MIQLFKILGIKFNSVIIPKQKLGITLGSLGQRLSAQENSVCVGSIKYTCKGSEAWIVNYVQKSG